MLVWKGEVSILEKELQAIKESWKGEIDFPKEKHTD